MELAESIVSEHKHLSSRVWVNRVWMHHFGKPLVENPSDFGLQTEQPLQHELLDFLASELIRQNWKIKPLHRLIMASKAYQRASLLGNNKQLTQQLEIDPENDFLWKANRRRLDLEQMRDSMLMVAGNLDKRQFGRPQLITDLKNKRRTIYAFVERQNIPNVVQSFDFANADTSTAKRPETTVPQQALFAMNSPFVIEHAKSLAKHTESMKTTTKKIRWLYQRVLKRTPIEHEINVLLGEAGANGIESVAQILLISNEFMFID